MDGFERKVQSEKYFKPITRGPQDFDHANG